MTAAYPLAWPTGWPRTPASRRKGPAFRSAGRAIDLGAARERLARELEALGATSTVLSTDVELRLDGRPRAGRPEPSDPGAAVYFRLDDRPMVLACDRWITVAGNVAAIAAHIEALRGMERWGVGTVERLFTGFLALPAPAAPGSWPAEHWRSVLVLHGSATLDEAEARYRELMRTAHPDAGGGHADAARLNSAITEARKELGGGDRPRPWMPAEFPPEDGRPAR